MLQQNNKNVMVHGQRAYIPANETILTEFFNEATSVDRPLWFSADSDEKRVVVF